MEFENIWDRIKNETDLSKMTQLANFIGVTQQFVSKRKKENIFPIEWAFMVAQKYNLSTDWIITGEGPKRNCDINKCVYKIPILQDVDNWLSDLVVKEPYRKEWFRASFEDSFPMFKEWEKRHHKEEGEDSTIPDQKIA